MSGAAPSKPQKTPSVTPIEAALAQATVPELDVEAARACFPALHQEVHPGKPLIYLDSAATALKPQSVIDAVIHIYGADCANVHRGVHALSQRATALYEGARDTVQRFVGAAHREEIIFTSGTTASINLVAMSLCSPKSIGGRLGEGDEVLVTELEHHSDIVSWQLQCERVGAKLVVVPIETSGEVTLDAFREKLSSRTRVVAFAHVSNALGTVLPVAKMAQLAHEAGALVVVDGAQGVVHGDVDVRALDVDFYSFSAHKLYGPSGVGVLYGKRELLSALPPVIGGGDMIDRVQFSGSTYNDLPYKFEAGTPNIAGVVGLGAAIEFLESLGMATIAKHEASLLAHGTERLLAIAGLRLIGTAPHKASVLAFDLPGVHPTDLGSLLDAKGIAIRTGHHCAQPVMDHFGLTGTARASIGLYNTSAELDYLAECIEEARAMFG